MVGPLLRRLRALFLPRPSGAEWDRAFAGGRWDFLRARGESARLALVAHQVGAAMRAGASIVDLGCGEGLLAARIAHLPYRAYLGVDLSAVAIARAGALASARNRFVVADAGTFVPPEPPDIVVLNEMLYYLPDPEAAVVALLAAMPPGGMLVVSIYDRLKTRWLWRMLRRHADPVDHLRLRNDAGTCWRIARFARR